MTITSHTSTINTYAKFSLVYLGHCKVSFMRLHFHVCIYSSKYEGSHLYLSISVNSTYSCKLTIADTHLHSIIPIKITIYWRRFKRFPWHTYRFENFKFLIDSHVQFSFSEIPTNDQTTLFKKKIIPIENV